MKIQIVGLVGCASHTPSIINSSLGNCDVERSPRDKEMGRDICHPIKLEFIKIFSKPTPGLIKLLLFSLG